MESTKKVEEMTKAIEAAKVTAALDGNWIDYYQKMEEFSDFLVEKAMACMFTLDLSSAINFLSLSSETLNEFTRNCLVYVDNMNEEEIENNSAYGIIVDHLEEAEILANISQGFTYYCFGLLNYTNRNPMEAINNFKKAKEEIDLLYEKTDLSIFNFFSNYADILILSSEGTEYNYRLNNNNALMAFQRASVLMEDLIDNLPNYFPEIPEIDKELVFGLNLTNIAIKKDYFFSEYRLQLVNGNFSAIIENAEELCNMLDKSIINSENNTSKAITNLQRGEYHYLLGHKYIAEGELNRELEKWEDSLNSYRKAKNEWKKSSNFHLKSGTPQSKVFQEVLLNHSLNIDSRISQIKQERDLTNRLKNLEDELNYLRKSVTESLKGSGVIVNTNQEMISTVEQNTQIIQSLGNNIKKNIEGLIKEVSDLPIDVDTKEEIKNMAEEVLKSQDKGNQFIEKAKKFTKDVSEITNNIGEIAKPILPFISALNLLR